MSESKKIPPGSIAWVDLTVDNADGLKDFYSEVVGWNQYRFIINSRKYLSSIFPQ